MRKGEHGVNIIYYSLREIEEKADEPARKVPLLKVFTVFNLEQLDGIADTQPVASHAWTPQAAAESVLRHSGATIRHQGYKAFYSTANDWIYLPQQRLFANAESYSDSVIQPGIRGGDAPGGLIDRLADLSGRECHNQPLPHAVQDRRCPVRREEGPVQLPVLAVRGVSTPAG